MFSSSHTDTLNKDQNKGILASINSYLRRNRIGEILVARGALTPLQLKQVLNLQKEHQKPLGQVLIDCGLVSKGQLRLALATQASFRVMVAAMTLLTSIATMSPRQAHAGNLKEIPASIHMADASAMMAVPARYTSGVNLFGTGERVSTDLSSFSKWKSMFDRFAQDVNDRQAQGVVRQWKNNLAELKDLPLYQMANEVNNLMNKVRYIGDTKNWGKTDYWETPIEFLTYGGDCEDFAIAKYVSLRALGVPDSAMRIAIVKDLQKGIPHAILIVYTEHGPMVLDNQIKRMTGTNDIAHYKPIFSINRTAWWLHTDNRVSNPTQVASAAR